MRKIVFHKVSFLLFLLAIGATGCRSVAPTVERTHTFDSTRIATYWKNYYLHQFDSVYHGHAIITDRSGDTIRITERDTIHEYHTIAERDTIRITDTIRTNTTDSIDRPVPVEKPLTGTQTFMIRSGWALWGILSLLILGGLVTLAIKLRI